MRSLKIVYAILEDIESPNGILDISDPKQAKAASILKKICQKLLISGNEAMAAKVVGQLQTGLKKYRE